MYLQTQPSTHPRAAWKERLLSLALKAGLMRIGRQLWERSLTVLNYHRVTDPDRPDFDAFKPNVSARPNEFARQMDYLSRWFNVVSLRDVVAWLDGRRSLPPHAALITFDDGYRDNHTFAYPILRRHNFPAVIFLTTAHIDNDIPFYWDLAAYCFAHTQRDRIPFPDGEERRWSDARQRDRVSREWIETMKVFPESGKQAWAERLPGLLDVSVPRD
ncbi:MAG: polysaccharide deacetylase family protein, partial [Chloroflexi bacterium]|nr:polysaccharide deacetylase family protein [Chloroflexota bacterium]